MFSEERVILFFSIWKIRFFYIFFYFSAYFFLNSVIVKFQSVKVRAMGLNFIVPLTLNISAFYWLLIINRKQKNFCFWGT